MKCPPNQYPACQGCGVCCILRDKNRLPDKEDNELRRQLYDVTGIVYLYPIAKFTATLTEVEKTRLERLAKENNRVLSIRPKRILLDKKLRPVIYDYFIDADICPFLNGKMECSIYNDRPLICHEFPKMKSDNEKFKRFSERKNLKPILSYDDALKAVEALML